MEQKTIRLVIEYVGTNYCGWQFQPNGISIQEVLETCLERITGEKPRVVGSGRTDAGVHAEGQVAHFQTTSRLRGPEFQRALNGILPPDIVIRESSREPASFHARFSQTGKRYRYVILNRSFPSALRRPYVWFLPHPFNLEAMREATRYLVGEHDFASFQAAKSRVQNRVRVLTLLDIQRQDDDLVFVFEGNGFLKHMIRIMVGTLVEVGLGKKTPARMKEILEARDRKKAGRTAPAQGLFLERVYYAKGAREREVSDVNSHD